MFTMRSIQINMSELSVCEEYVIFAKRSLFIRSGHNEVERGFSLIFILNSEIETSTSERENLVYSRDVTDVKWEKVEHSSWVRSESGATGEEVFISSS